MRLRHRPLPVFLLVPFFAALALFWLIPIAQGFHLSLQSDTLFGEPEFDVMDLLRMTADGHGVISLLELSDVMEKPRLFSTFMLWILAQLIQQGR